MFAYFSSVLCMITGGFTVFRGGWLVCLCGWVVPVWLLDCRGAVGMVRAGAVPLLLDGVGLIAWLWWGCSPGSRWIAWLLPGSMFPWLLDSLVWCSLDWRAVDCMAVVIGCSRF